MTTGIAEITKPKDLLDRSIPITSGDFVTIYDDADFCKVGLVKSIDEGIAVIYNLLITEENDDIYLEEKEIEVSQLVYLDDSFVNVNGVLWQIRDCIKNNSM